MAEQPTTRVVELPVFAGEGKPPRRLAVRPETIVSVEECWSGGNTLLVMTGFTHSVDLSYSETLKRLGWV